MALLTAKTIGVIIPSLGDLVHGKDAPMFLVMRPQEPPTFTMGKGTFTTDAHGTKTIDDALLHITVPNFGIDFYAFVDEHYVRVMTLTADLQLPVALDVDANSQIVPLLGDLTKAFTNASRHQLRAALGVARTISPRPSRCCSGWPVGSSARCSSRSRCRR